VTTTAPGKSSRAAFRWRKIASSATLHAIALLVAALYAVPMAYVVLVALTPDGEAPGTWPSHAAFGTFVDAFRSADFLRFFINSALVSVFCTVLQVILSCAAGYALAMLPVRGRTLILLLLLALLVVPAEVAIVPLFVMVSHFPLTGGNDLFGFGGHGLLNTLPGIMVPHIVSALAIVMMRQFYAALPRELGDAARIDGLGEIGIFALVYTPLVKPAIAIVAVFAFQSAWNDFIWPLVVTQSNDMRTLQLGLTVFFQENSTQWNLLMAAVLVISFPIIILFLLVQRVFNGNALSGALK
jgi:multiple sugar transport system permease protein